MRVDVEAHLQTGVFLDTHPLHPLEPQRQPRRLRRILTLIVVAVVASLIAVSSQAASLPGGASAEVGWLSAFRDVSLARLGEQPALAAQPWEGDLLLCEPYSAARVRAFEDGVAMMRSTETGRALFNLLYSEGICIGAEELAYNSAYASARWSPVNGWAESEIRIDPSFVTFLYPDVLAAILVHEATHLQRAVDRTACYYADTCTVLPNGVQLEEEVVAHSAEAEFWLEIYGRDGKGRAFARDTSQNQLKSHYLQGPQAFREFVHEMRSNQREGEGI